MGLGIPQHSCSNESDTRINISTNSCHFNKTFDLAYTGGTVDIQLERRRLSKVVDAIAPHGVRIAG